MVNKHCPSLKGKKPLLEEFLGAVECEPEYDSYRTSCSIAFLNLRSS